ncbi:MAG: thiolase family protein [Sphingopyxis sp.]
MIIAGGVQSTSTAPTLSWRDPATGETHSPWGPPTHPDRPDAPNRDMSITVGWNTAKLTGITRAEMDAWAVRSHHRAAAAIEAGHFHDEIVPVSARKEDGSFFEFATDEHPRRDSSLEKLATLKPIHPEIADFPITAGNASGVNDAASALVITRDDVARSEGLGTRARLIGWTSLGSDPARTGMAAIDVIEKLLAKAGRSAADISLWEINEAFAVVPLAACRQFSLDEDRVNISGSGCSIGHPVAASGGRMIATLIRDLERRGGGLGVAAMCAGGGQAGAVLIEV